MKLTKFEEEIIKEKLPFIVEALNDRSIELSEFKDIYLN